MTNKERDKIRRLQKKVMGTYDFKRFVDDYGEDWPLFGDGSPTTKELRKYIFPEWVWRFEEFLAERGGRR